MSAGTRSIGMRDEFLDADLGEVGELLVAASGLLLAIDAPQRAREATPRQIRELFRALHTVKGLSAMVGVDAVVAIAHRAEALLRGADRSGGVLRPGAVDLLLQAVRAIDQRVRALAAHKTPAPAPEGLLEALDAMDDTSVTAGRPTSSMVVVEPSLDAKLAPFERDALSRGVIEGRRAVCVHFAPSPAMAAAGATITTVRERLATCCEIVKVVPVSVAKSDAAPAGLSFAMLALTGDSDTAIAAAIGLPPAAIETLEQAPPSAAAEPQDTGSPTDDAVDEDDVTLQGFVRVGVARLDEVIAQFGVLMTTRGALGREIDAATARGQDTRNLRSLARDQDRALRTLRAAILRLRMVPITEMLERVPLLLRGLRRATGKSVRLELDAGRSELDKSVAERLFPAIVHLVRNAVDHAIEAPDERVARGKPVEGVVSISARAHGNGQIELVVRDDGRGVDAQAVATRAGAPMPATSAALLALLCRAGLSTRDQATDTSGRGMGMDIVHRVVVNQLGGELVLRTEPGRGSEFTVRVPLTVSIIDAFAFECGSQRFVVPLAAVDAIVEVPPSAVVQPPGGGSLGMLSRAGETIPLVWLDALLGMQPSSATWARSKALIVRRDGWVLAFAVDRMVGQQEVVVRPLGDPLVEIVGFTGATDLGDGRATLVIDLFALGDRIGDAARPKDEAAA